MRREGPQEGGSAARSNTALPPAIQQGGRRALASSQKPIPKLAQDDEELGIAGEPLRRRRWIEQHGIEEGEREGPTTEQSARATPQASSPEVGVQINQERDFPKKSAAAFFAREGGDR